MDSGERRKIYDVHRPHMVGAEPTSKPVIVSHRPTIPDPMLREGHGQTAKPPVTPEPVPVAGTPAPPALMTAPAEPVESAQPLGDNLGAALQPDNVAAAPDLTPAPTQNSALPKPQPPAGSDMEVHLPAGKLTGGGRGKEWLLWFIILLLVGAAVYGVYLALNRSQKSQLPPTNQSSATSTPSQTSQTTVPAGFTAFEVPNTNIGFNYPTAWGTPSTVVDPGFSKRGGTNQSDGTHAYLVNFATNKDVQVAITSSKYLPAARAGLYYDVLQWCLGTNDAKYYFETLHYTTTAGVDTPSTRVCDLGPLSDASKLSNVTIVQLKTKDASGTVIGDLYTVNLSDKSLPVLRVKDAAMSNGDNIKKLLDSITVSASAQ